MIEFDGIEGVIHSGNGAIHLAFETDNRGIWQTSWADGGLNEFPHEPPIETLRKSDQEYVERIGIIIFYFTFGRPPEHLSDASA